MDIGELLDARFREQAQQIERLRRELEEMKRGREEVPAEEWITKRSFLKRHAERFTEGSLDWLLFQRENNGLAPFVRKPGRVLLIQERRFLEAVLALGPTPRAGAPAPRRRRSRGAGHAKHTDGPWKRFASRQEP